MMKTNYDYAVCGSLGIFDTIERVLTETGYIKDGLHHAFIKDYQGNVRLLWSESLTSGDGECNHYYPYGVLIAGTMPPDNEQPYKYSAKELDRENGLDWYDFAARMYDPTLGRFTTMDPLCEKTPWLSPYLYCATNPVRYIDPTGMDIALLHYNGLHSAMLIQGYDKNLN